MRVLNKFLIVNVFCPVHLLFVNRIKVIIVTMPKGFRWEACQATIQETGISKCNNFLVISFLDFEQIFLPGDEVKGDDKTLEVKVSTLSPRPRPWPWPWLTLLISSQPSSNPDHNHKGEQRGGSIVDHVWREKHQRVLCQDPSQWRPYCDVQCCKSQHIDWYKRTWMTMMLMEPMTTGWWQTRSHELQLEPDLPVHVVSKVW